MNRKHYKFKVFISLSAVILILGGCRPSPTLEQIIYTSKADQLDEEENQLDPEDEGIQSDEFANEKDKDSKIKRDTSDNLAKEDEDVTSDSKAENIKTSPTGDSDKTGSDQSEDETGSKDKEENGKKEEDEKSKQSSDKATDDASASRKVVDATGDEVAIPENVETVAAVGAAASMVEMLGGTGRLVGSDEAFTQNQLADDIFEDVSDIETWWNESGKTPLGDDAFESLIQKKPDVCFEISGDHTFSSNQIDTLKKNGIAYFVLPALDSKSSLQTAVHKMAEVLNKNKTTGKSSVSIAENYNDWVEKVVSECKKQSSDVSLSSIYISEWTDAEYYLNEASGLPKEAGLKDGTTGQGVAVAWSAKKDELIDTFMSASGVINESSSFTSRYNATDGTYVMPMFTQFSPTFSSDSDTFYSKGVAAGYDLFLYKEVSVGNYKMLGDEVFPAIIVANDEIKDQINHNWFWEYHGGVHTPSLNWQAGYWNGTNAYYSSVCDEYDIFVNPSGIGDWAEGCVESPLEAYWIGFKFADTFDQEKVHKEVSDFYQTYFNASISDGQVKEILGE